jgi:hypothetical protein
MLWPVLTDDPYGALAPKARIMCREAVEQLATLNVDVRGPTDFPQEVGCRGCGGSLTAEISQGHFHITVVHSAMPPRTIRSDRYADVDEEGYREAIALTFEDFSRAHT